MQIIKNIISGMIIGVANIIPGVSGGTMAVVLGLYDKLINAVSLTKESLKKNWKLILSVALGAGAGILLFAKLLTWSFDNYPVATNFGFIGLIFGSLPLVYKKTVEKKKFKIYNVIPFALTLAGMIAMSVIKSSENIVQKELDFNLACTLIITTAIAAVACIIPGISGSFVLKALGQYETVLAAIDRLDILMLIPVAIGVGVGILGGAKLISVVLKKFHQGIYSAILGLIVGSIFVIFPRSFTFNTEGFIAIGTFVAGAAIAIIMEKLGKD